MQRIPSSSPYRLAVTLSSVLLALVMIAIGMPAAAQAESGHRLVGHRAGAHVKHEGRTVAHVHRAAARHTAAATKRKAVKKGAVKPQAGSAITPASSVTNVPSTAAAVVASTASGDDTQPSAAVTNGSAAAASDSATGASASGAASPVTALTASSPTTLGTSPADFNRDTFDYSSQLTDSQEAGRYQFMVMYSTDAAKVAELHAANPSLKILMYSESLFSDPNDPQGLGTCTPYPTDNASDPSWFLTDQNGNRVLTDGRDMMDVGNPAYQQACVAHAVALAKQDGFNGIMFDNVDADWQWDVPAGTDVAAYPTDASWQAAEQSFLDYAGPAVRAAGLLATANLGVTDTTMWADWSTPLDGSAEQGFTDGGQGLAQQVPFWSMKVADAAWSESHDKYAILNSQNETEAGNVYGLASMLLVANGYSSYSTSNSGVSAASNSSDENWYPEYGDAEQLGAATGAYTQLPNGVYERVFQNGIVLVNPTTSSVPTFSLPGTYSGATTPSTSSVSMPSTSGLILLTNS